MKIKLDENLGRACARALEAVDMTLQLWSASVLLERRIVYLLTCVGRRGESW